MSKSQLTIHSLNGIHTRVEYKLVRSRQNTTQQNFCSWSYALFTYNMGSKVSHLRLIFAHFCEYTVDQNRNLDDLHLLYPALLRRLLPLSVTFYYGKVQRCSSRAYRSEAVYVVAYKQLHTC